MIDLLTFEEAKQLPLWVRACGVGWWTKSKGKFENTMSVVFDDGQAQEYGPAPMAEDFGVRPCLYLPDNVYLRPLYEVRQMYGTFWFHIGDYKWLACDIIGRYRFGNTQEYALSDIKKWLESWIESRS